jgi:hypothetical protein
MSGIAHDLKPMRSGYGKFLPCFAAGWRQLTSGGMRDLGCVSIRDDKTLIVRQQIRRNARRRRKKNLSRHSR